MTSHTIEKSLILAAAPANVWAFLTDPDKLAIWFHRPDNALTSPGPFSMPGEDGEPLVWGEVREARAPSHLSYSFTARPMGGHMTEVTWELSELEAGTRLRLTHSGIPAGAEAFGLLTGFDGGWDRHLLSLREASAAD
ncbi:SRPBCC family protein [Gymnodinialimonas ceratoperidinii]|uniref:SRPBCC domain-containing protein n=1 Tax=Gymnodinialimonas ceratoperidinii TaxID=2856823 RepID=A0A8F6TXH0_9RHOB|nr:SRPBCC domain-containing protein [Gymnodinialimonas ceratoperidinii]QXT40721.1 SRPBCC domain-containing protein [Gymnodinialimonas ceratoperidinii]